MRFRPGRPTYRWGLLGAVVAVALLVVPPSAGVANSSGAPRGAPAEGAIAARAPSDPFLTSPRSAVPDSRADGRLPGSVPGGPVPDTSLPIVVSFTGSNESRLSALLRTLTAPSNGATRPYLSAEQFDREFAPPARTYDRAAAYFGSFGVTNLVTYPGRTAITFDATPPVADEIFDTTIGSFSVAGASYLAPTSRPSLPAPIASAVVQVAGLGTGSSVALVPETGGVLSAGARSPDGLPQGSPAGVYVAPAQLGAAQIEYGPDFQVAYDELSLFSAYGEPRNATVALLTGSGTYGGSAMSTACGSLSTGEDVGPWDPADVSAFFAETLPAGEHPATVAPVALGSATGPGCLASWDTSGVAAANTVDLEMIGSTAPGARIYGVYGASPTESQLDTDLLTVLEPGAPLSASEIANLENVSVVETPWAFADTNDSTWYSLLSQAEARGITLLAATGNSADDPESAAWVGSDAEFPASMAYNTFGDVAVGGTTVTLDDRSLAISSQVVWNVSAKDTAHGGPSGTAGGISKLIAEPSWQKSTSASTVLNGKNRGVPDLAALANDTAATVTIDGAQARATNASSGGLFYNASGTGTAVSLTAGLFAEVDHSLLSAGDSVLGFADPTIYPLASAEYAALPNGAVHGAGYTTNYTSPLPTLPFRDVVDGRNDLDKAAAGYDLVSGWGSLDAYNFTMYLLAPKSLPAYGPLRAVQDWVNFTTLGISPAAPDGAPLAGAVASIQQNLFLANALGAPIIWVQSVLYLEYDGGGTWTVNFTAWSVFPFWGIYPNDSVYEYWYPKTGDRLTGSLAFDLVTYITPERPSWDSVLTFEFGNGVAPISLTVPGAQYLLGGFDHRYSWEGTNYTNGPGPAGTVRGFLAPQVGLVGSPGSPPANGTSAMSGTVSSFVEPIGASSFEPAQTSVVSESESQTAERSENISYTATSGNDWQIGYTAGSSEQGIAVVEPFRYPVTFAETGAPSSIGWSVSLSTGAKLSGTGADSSLVAELENGTFGYTVATTSHNYTVAPTSGDVTVAGGPQTVPITFTAKIDSVTFVASGAMAFPFDWKVWIDGGAPIESSSSDLETNLTYAKYTYHIGSVNSSWAPASTHRNGTFTIGASPVTLDVTFDLVTFDVKVTPVYGVGVLLPWTVTVGGTTKNGHADTPFKFPLPNGTYKFEISGLPAHASAVPSNGTIVVDGLPPPNVLITIHAPPAGPGGFGNLGVWGFVLVGGVTAAVVLVGVIVVSRRRRAREPPEPPEPPPPRAPSAKGRPPRRPPPPPSRRREYISPDEV